MSNYNLVAMLASRWWNDSRKIFVGFSGSALVVVLLVISVLSVLGMVAIDTTVVDMEIATSHKELRENFYLAEAAAMEGVQRLLNSPVIDLIECISYWHHDLEKIEQENLDFTLPGNWHSGNPGNANVLQSILNPYVFMVAAEHRVAGGSSLISTGSRLYVNRIYGRCTQYNADSIVQVGYYMRY